MRVRWAYCPSKSWLAQLAAGYNAYVALTLTLQHENAYLTVSVEHDSYNVSLVHAKLSVVNLHCYP